MPEKATEWFGMRVTPSQKETIKRLAEREDTTQKAAVLNAVERRLDDGGQNDATDEALVEPQPGSVLALTQDLRSSIDEPNLPTDLSSNPKHMKGYCKD